MKQRKLSGGTIYILIIIVLVLAFASTVLGGFTPYDPATATPQNATAVNVDPNTIKVDNSGLKNLQLYTFGETSISLPQPKQTKQTTVNKSTAIPIPTEEKGVRECSSSERAQVYAKLQSDCPQSLNTGNTNGGTVKCSTQVRKSMTSQFGCTLGKPVIYLYPARPTFVHVSLRIPGRITKSFPAYPSNGWNNILAFPSGRLFYQGQNYNELFYESYVDNIKMPGSGIIMKSSDLVPEITRLTGQLGLLPVEQQEFLDYWVPKLKTLHAPYILFSLIDEDEKERIDHVEITPKPDTMIAFLVYFRPLQTALAPIKPLILPSPPERKGFTAVEWGGIIGN